MKLIVILTISLKSINIELNTNADYIILFVIEEQVKLFIERTKIRQHKLFANQTILHVMNVTVLFVLHMDL